jgi:two-component system nitrate/nitrite response regulator NarL
VQPDRPLPKIDPVAKPERLRILVVSEVRLFAEGLTQALERDETVRMFQPCSDLADALCKIPELRPDILLLDATISTGPETIDLMLSVAPRLRIVVFAIAETADNIIAWVEAGAAGFIPRTTALSDLVQLLAAIMRDEQVCSSRVVAGLMRRLRNVASTARGHAESRALPALTVREMQVIDLICAGHSNKDIARRLNIGVATTKSHVHNLLGKLNLQRRNQVAPWMRDLGPRFGAGPAEPPREAAETKP